MGAQGAHPWDGPILAAGLVAGVIWFSAAMFGVGPHASSESDPPTRMRVAMPERVAASSWPLPTAAPGADALVPWRLLPPRYSTIPIEPGGDVSDPASRFGSVDGGLDHGRAASSVVTLTALEKDVSLDPCPDYIVRWRGTETRRGLDCAGVPFRDARGAPYLPEGVPVRFEIALQLDSWELAAPGGVVLPPDQP